MTPLWEIVNDDVMNWAKNYKGKPFMALLCDPPYHLHDGKGKGGFMNREWDGPHDTAFRPETWAALAEHLLPGAFILAFASSRGWHRLACAMEDSGLVMQPSIFVNGLEMDVPLCIGWATGQSFPKATRIDTAIDKAAGKLSERRVIGHRQYERSPYKADGTRSEQGDGRWSSARALTKPTVVEPATPLARAWQGHRYGGQILKNALEPIICAQKPWAGKRLDCIVETGAGAINVDGGRIAAGQDYNEAGWGPRYGETSMPNMGGHQTRPWVQDAIADGKPVKDSQPSLKGRWPQNLILIHSPFCLRDGEQRVKGAGWRDTDKRTHSDHIRQLASDGRDEGKQHYADADGLETVTAWRCLIACPECGHSWLAVDKEVCPECKAMGEWQCAVKRLGEQSGERPVSGTAKLGKVNISRPGSATVYGKYNPHKSKMPNDSGDCTRYFHQADWSYEIAERLAMANPVHYCPKSSRRERNAGLDLNIEREIGHNRFDSCVKCGGYILQNPNRPSACKCEKPERQHNRVRGNPHPTCKPLSLNRYLSKLLLPPPEYAPRQILIPFAGVMSEAIGAMLANFEEIVAIEMDAEYCKIGEARMKYWASRPEQLRLL